MSVRSTDARISEATSLLHDNTHTASTKCRYICSFALIFFALVFGSVIYYTFQSPQHSSQQTLSNTESIKSITKFQNRWSVNNYLITNANVSYSDYHHGQKHLTSNKKDKSDKTRTRENKRGGGKRRKGPTQSPTKSPSKSPTYNPSISPTDNPSLFPTYDPTISPSKSPSMQTYRFYIDLEIIVNSTHANIDHNAITNKIFNYIGNINLHAPYQMDVNISVSLVTINDMNTLTLTMHEVTIAIHINTNDETDKNMIVEYANGKPFKQELQNLMMDDPMAFTVGYTDSLENATEKWNWSDLSKWTAAQYCIVFTPLIILITIILCFVVDCSKDSDDSDDEEQDSDFEHL